MSEFTLDLVDTSPVMGGGRKHSLARKTKSKTITKPRSYTKSASTVEHDLLKLFAFKREQKKHDGKIRLKKPKLMKVGGEESEDSEGSDNSDDEIAESEWVVDFLGDDDSNAIVGGFSEDDMSDVSIGDLDDKVYEDDELRGDDGDVNEDNEVHESIHIIGAGENDDDNEMNTLDLIDNIADSPTLNLTDAEVEGTLLLF